MQVGGGMTHRTDETQLTADEVAAKIRELAEAGQFCFQCCFCHQEIEGAPHALILVTHWDGPEDKQKSQQWFCHAECFTKATGERIEVLREDA